MFWNILKALHNVYEFFSRLLLRFSIFLKFFPNLSQSLFQVLLFLEFFWWFKKFLKPFLASWNIFRGLFNVQEFFQSFSRGRRIFRSLFQIFEFFPNASLRLLVFSIFFYCLQFFWSFLFRPMNFLKAFLWDTIF